MNKLNISVILVLPIVILYFMCNGFSVASYLIGLIVGILASDLRYLKTYRETLEDLKG